MMSAQVSAGVRAGGNHPNMSVRSTCLNEPPQPGNPLVYTCNSCHLHSRLRQALYALGNAEKCWKIMTFPNMIKKSWKGHEIWLSDFNKFLLRSSYFIRSFQRPLKAFPEGYYYRSLNRAKRSLKVITSHMLRVRCLGLYFRVSQLCEVLCSKACLKF